MKNFCISHWDRKLVTVCGGKKGIISVVGPMRRGSKVGSVFCDILNLFLLCHFQQIEWSNLVAYPTVTRKQLQFQAMQIDSVWQDTTLSILFFFFSCFRYTVNAQILYDKILLMWGGSTLIKIQNVSSTPVGYRVQPEASVLFPNRIFFISKKVMTQDWTGHREYGGWDGKGLSLVGRTP